jgi:transcriptional antiterminator
MLTDRRQRLLRLMLSVESPLTASEIGRHIQCPAHSVRYDLEALDQWVSRLGAQLVSTAGVGYHLAGDLERIRWALEQFSQDKDHDYVLSPRERVRHLLLHLLGESQNQPLQSFAERLRVGKSTVHADLAAVGNWAQARGITLERSIAGVRTDGTETLRRQAMADLVMELADEGQLAMLMDGHPDADPLQALLQPMLPFVDWLAIGDAVREAESPQLGVHLAIMVSRLASGSALPFNPEQSESVAGTEELSRAEAMAESIEKRCRARIPSTERAALAQYLGASRLTANKSTPDMLSQADLELARTLAVVVQSRLGVMLAQDQDFVIGLALHLLPVRHRLRRGLVMDNPLLTEIRVKFAAAYRAASWVLWASPSSCQA